MPKTSTKASKATKKVALPAPRARRKNRNLPPGICRVEQPSTRTYGFVVRVGHRQSLWRWRRVTACCDFSHGGKKEALAAAVVKWLKTLERTGKAPEKERAKSPGRPRSKKSAKK